MLSGVQYMPSLKMEAIAEGGFSYAEIPYELIERNGLPTYEKKEGESRLLRVSGLTYPLQDVVSDKLYALLEAWKLSGTGDYELQTGNIGRDCGRMCYDACGLWHPNFY